MERRAGWWASGAVGRAVSGGQRPGSECSAGGCVPTVGQQAQGVLVAASNLREDVATIDDDWRRSVGRRRTGRRLVGTCGCARSSKGKALSTEW